MDENEITSLLRSPDRDLTRRTWRCPDENLLVAYVNGQLSDRRKVEKHLADCKACLETVSLVINQVGEEKPVPPGVLARARSLADTPRAAKWNLGWMVAAATTACLLILASILLWQHRSAQQPIPPTELVAQRNDPTLPGKESPANINSTQSQTAPHVEKPKIKDSPAPVVRGVAGGPKLTLLFPREGSSVRPPIPAIRWSPVADAMFYEVKIVTEDGAAVVTQTTNSTELLLAPGTVNPGSKYFVTVVAHLTGNRTIKSELVKFRVAESQ